MTLKRNTKIKETRDERYRMSDIKTSVRSELQGSEFVGLLGGESCNDIFHLDCGHKDITGRFITVKPIRPQLTFNEQETAERYANSELNRMILRLRDWSVMYSKARKGYTILHPIYLEIAKITPIAWGNTQIHKYRHKR